jgi:2-dehydropantoate 2-reductase
VLEADALIGSVIELARMADVATPHIDAIYAVTKLLGQTLIDAKGRLGMAPT